MALNIHPVDIVFIHGLNGHYMRTWTHQKGTCWPKDLLPQALPAARIFSYGYPSQIFAGRSVAGIREFAKQLMSCLDSERAEDVSRDRQRQLTLDLLKLCRRIFDQSFTYATVLGELYSSR